MCVLNFHIRWWSLPAWWEVGGESQRRTRVKRYNRSHFVHNLLFWVLWLMVQPRQWSHLYLSTNYQQIFLRTLMIVLYTCDSLIPRPLLLSLFTVWLDCKQSQELIKNWDQNLYSYSQSQTTILESRPPFLNPKCRGSGFETTVIYVMYLLLFAKWDIFPGETYNRSHFSLKIVPVSQSKLEPTFHAHLSSS